VSDEPRPAGDDLRPVEQGDLIEYGETKRGGLSLRTLGLLVGLLIVVNLAALIVAPPVNEKHAGEACAYPVCFIEGTLHFPRPHEVWVAGGEEASSGLISTQVSLTDSLLTMILLTVLVLVLGAWAARRRADVPGRVQNFLEWTYESISSFGLSMGGAKAARYLPLFAAFFVLILVFNWSGLVPPIGHLDGLRAPTSDLNVTVGLALVAFFTFHIEGVRRLGARSYLSKFFPFGEFRSGIGAGLIAVFVGLVEFMLEFIKPVTLSMRLFGNIFGGEVALAVVLGLSAGLLAPIALYGLEIILTFVQALIFSTLTLMFILVAIESHHDDEGHEREEAMGGAA
jgi:F-type H+-transporting ATPase subunit a